jgi:hypothetical protein
MVRSTLVLVLVWSILLGTASGQKVNDATQLYESELLDVEIRLQELGYWVGDADGRFDERTSAAIAAFRRINGYENYGAPNVADLAPLAKASPLKFKGIGDSHFEVDLERQVLFFVDTQGNVTMILPVSTGSGRTFKHRGRTKLAKTPTGVFTIFRKLSGWHETSLGQMYYPSYISGGIAIHGSSFVADYPRTHGCIAVPLFTAAELNEMMPLGTVVVIRKRSHLTI